MAMPISISVPRGQPPPGHGDIAMTGTTRDAAVPWLQPACTRRDRDDLIRPKEGP
jgi:hypothetical protein